MKKLNSKGFSSVEGLLVLVIILVIAGVGYYVWHSQNKASNTYSSSSSGSAAVDPYASWHTVKLTTAKVSLRYPVSWKAGTVTSTSAGDSVALTGDNGYTLDVAYNVNKPGSEFIPTVEYAKSLTFSGKKVYLDYLSGSNDKLVDSVQLSQSATDPFSFPVSGAFTVNVHGQYDTNAKGKSVAQAKADTNYRDTALVVSSAKTVK